MVLRPAGMLWSVRTTLIEKLLGGVGSQPVTASAQHNARSEMDVDLTCSGLRLMAFLQKDEVEAPKVS
jgi:hypothetical protein